MTKTAVTLALLLQLTGCMANTSATEIDDDSIAWGGAKTDEATARFDPPLWGLDDELERQTADALSLLRQEKARSEERGEVITSFAELRDALIASDESYRAFATSVELMAEYSVVPESDPYYDDLLQVMKYNLRIRRWLLPGDGGSLDRSVELRLAFAMHFTPARVESMWQEVPSAFRQYYGGEAADRVAAFDKGADDIARVLGLVDVE